MSNEIVKAGREVTHRWEREFTNIVGKAPARVLGTLNAQLAKMLECKSMNQIQKILDSEELGPYGVVLQIAGRALLDDDPKVAFGTMMAIIERIGGKPQLAQDDSGTGTRINTVNINFVSDEEKKAVQDAFVALNRSAKDAEIEI